MFTAASASVVYLSFGGIPFDYGLAAFLSGLLWTMLGQVRAPYTHVLAAQHARTTLALCCGGCSWRPHFSVFAVPVG